MPFPIIDLFAGPGGLAEGFSTLTGDDGERIFDIKLSIEKDDFAHQTLTLRSFVRQFPLGNLPEEYYSLYKGDITVEQLYQLYPDEYQQASEEAWLATLGETSSDEIDDKIINALDGNTEWVLIGGPPCQAYSNVGRSRVGGISKDDHRVYLYREYLRIISHHHPLAFVMENVEGLLSATLDGDRIFNWILRDLREPSSVFNETDSPSYKIYSLTTHDVKKDSDYLIKAEDYGIPQCRHRVILLGVREDVIKIPGILNPSEKVTLRSVIGRLPKIRSGISKSFSHSQNIKQEDGKTKKKRCYNKVENSYENWLSHIQDFTNEVAHGLDIDSETLPARYPKNMGSEYFDTNSQLLLSGHILYNWYIDQNLTGISHHVSRKHLLQDLKRYLFAALYTQLNHRFPKLNDYKLFDEDLLPDHENVNSGKFTDRFRVQLPNRPATTITSHISKDGHYFIHYDPSQCRSLTVREAARIQTFPDNYIFCGSRTEQFHQVGNAVPPYLAYQIAQIVSNLLL